MKFFSRFVFISMIYTFWLFLLRDKEIKLFGYFVFALSYSYISISN